MSAISATSSSAYTASALLLSGETSSSASTDANAPAAKSSTDSTNSSSKDPTDVVDLSDRAKAIIARAKFEKTVADQLQSELDQLTLDGSPADASKPSSNNGKVSFDSGSASFEDLVKSSANAPRSRTFVNGVEVSAIVTASYDFKVSASIEADGFSESVSVERKGFAVADLDTNGRPIYGGFVTLESEAAQFVIGDRRA